MTHLSEPSAAFLEGLRELLGPKGWLPADGHPGYFTEPRGKWRGRGALIARPILTEEVAEVVRRCAAAGVGVVPVSGGTGLVAGQIATDGPTPVLLSTERMDRVREVSREDAAITVEGGCVLETVQQAAEAAGMLFPLRYASQGSARIGGALAANSGGVQVIRYGNARDLCLGLEAGLPDGSVFHGLKSLRKDNTGYDLRNLLIGAEGTLGVITAATLKLFPRPAETATALCALRSPADALTLLRKLQETLGESVSAFELIARQGIDFVLDHIDRSRDPMEAKHPWYALLEIGAPGAAEALEGALGELWEEYLEDAVLASNEAQRQELWRLRENIPLANAEVGAIASHDISIPIGRIAEFIAEGDDMARKVAPGARINCFGHLGDGNLHYNFYPPEGRRRDAPEFKVLAPLVTRAVHDLTHHYGGSISAEHGIGRAKRDDLARYGDPAKLAAMRAIKRALDPVGIMNPGAVLSGEEERT
ncbi:MAG: FAD-binding oxidoreductase [Neomegalonema sp.]